MVELNDIICHSYCHSAAAKQRQGKEAFFRCMNEMERREEKDGDRGSEV